MAGGGGKGGSQETTVELDPRLEQGAVEAITGALNSASLPFNTNQGPQFAAFTPQQEAAFQGANDAAAAFGLPTSGNLGIVPAQQTAMPGLQAYSTGALYDQAMGASFSADDIAARDAILADYAAGAQRVLDTPVEEEEKKGGK